MMLVDVLLLFLFPASVGMTGNHEIPELEFAAFGSTVGHRGENIVILFLRQFPPLSPYTKNFLLHYLFYDRK